MMRTRKNIIITALISASMLYGCGVEQHPGQATYPDLGNMVEVDSETSKCSRQTPIDGEYFRLRCTASARGLQVVAKFSDSDNGLELEISFHDNGSSVRSYVTHRCITRDSKVFICRAKGGVHNSKYELDISLTVDARKENIKAAFIVSASLAENN